jgi:hypothetical protein
MTWLAEQQIPLIRIDWKGNAQSVIGGGQFANPERVAAQIEAKRNGRALAIATGLIREKIENAIATLEAVIPPSPTRELAVIKHRRDAKELEAKPPKSLAALLGIEGRTAQAYFAAWQSIPIKWKGLTRRAIPDDWHRVGQRQSLIGTRTKGRNRHASHPVNAMLNYAYAILESQVRIQIVAAVHDEHGRGRGGARYRSGACLGRRPSSRRQGLRQAPLATGTLPGLARFSMRPVHYPACCGAGVSTWPIARCHDWRPWRPVSGVLRSSVGRAEFKRCRPEIEQALFSDLAFGAIRN